MKAICYSTSLNVTARKRRINSHVDVSIITDSVDSREPEDWVSRLLRLLDRSLGEDGGEPP